MKTQDTQHTATHTPGPWAVSSIRRAAITCRTGYVAEVIYPHFDTSSEVAEIEANSRLIASAPELLRALENLTEKVRLAHGYGQITADFSADYNAALAAIARATR